MKNKSLPNREAISELGILSTAQMKLQEMQMVDGDPLAAFQHRILNWNGRFNMLVDIAANEIAEVVRRSRKINKVLFAGYEAMLMDKVVGKIDRNKIIIVIPNSPYVNFKRIEMNHGTTNNFFVQEIYRAWETTGNGAIVFVPYFELQDGSVWVYRYCAPILNEQLFSKARTILGINLLNQIQIEQGYDTYGELLLLAEINPNIFQSIISIEPKIITYELDNYSHSA